MVERRGVPPGRALDLACGEGRHALWLRDRGWKVTAVDIAVGNIGGVTCIQADLESGGFAIEPNAWDLIVCWLYWQEELLPRIVGGVRSGGLVAMAGKTTGRFGTSLDRFRRVFRGWEPIGAGQDEYKVYFIAIKP
jgi:SAM-dependent methyltransferase